MTLRMTKKRVSVMAALANHQEFVSAQHLHECMAESGDAVGLATVYRTLTALAEAHEIDSLRDSDGETLYRLCESEAHHHHLICRECGATVEIDGPSVETWAEAMGSDHGYTSISHTIELWGICPTCSNAAAHTVG
ncbi:MAG: transcriptional repressor [Cellulomonadaceae bacterium]|jgi:Fur family ferric uptake transcriptional regulator|nr:transcriptional repressor [Cellulomonadaceae bacterium]